MQEYIKIHQKIELPFCRVQLVCCNWKYFGEGWCNNLELRERGCLFLQGPAALLFPNKFRSPCFTFHMPVPIFLFSRLITEVFAEQVWMS